jgi:hypothetical protein
MTDSNPFNAPPLSLPAAALNAPSRTAHPDSEEVLQYGRHRVAQELETRHVDNHCDASTSSLRPPTLRARGTHSLTADLRRRQSGASPATDASEPEGEYARTSIALGNVRRWTKRWYGPTATFWKTQVNVVVEDGDHRDYLGR